MKDTLTPGLTQESRYVVTEDMSPPHLPRKVLSTPAMIQLMEGTCLGTAQPHLDEGETTVGTHVCVSHVGGAAPGEEVVVSCRLTDVVKRRLTFDVRAACGDRLLGEGTHQRAVIDTRRFAAG